MAGPRKAFRRIGHKDVERSLERLSNATDYDREFFELMLAYWKYLCDEDPVCALWVLRQIEKLVNMFSQVSEGTAFELLWKTCNFASKDSSTLEKMLVKGEQYIKQDDPRVARLSGKIYI